MTHVVTILLAQLNYITNYNDTLYSTVIMPAPVAPIAIILNVLINSNKIVKMSPRHI